MQHRSLITAVAVLVSLTVAGCGGDQDSSSQPSPSASGSTSATADPSPSGPPELRVPTRPLRFHLRTSDDSLDLRGRATGRCDNPGEGDLRVSFTSGGSTVAVDAANGTGSVVVTGAEEFEARADKVSVGDDGSVRISGTGSASDESSTATAFALVGSCMPPPTPASPTTAATPSQSAQASPAFTLTTRDGSVRVTGGADRCVNDDESSLRLVFGDDLSTVTVQVSGGRGSLFVRGASEFEGRVDGLVAGDDGSVTVTGSGSPADPEARPTTFRIVGSCA